MLGVENGSNQVTDEEEVVDTEKDVVETSEENLEKVISSDTGGGDFTDLDDFENSKYLNPPESCGFWGGIIKACFEDPDEYPTMTASIDVITKSSRNN